jgi:hypothetical protein
MELPGDATFTNVDLRLNNAEIRNYGQLQLIGGSSSNITYLTVPNSGLKNFGSIIKTGAGQSTIGVGLVNDGEQGGSIAVESGTLIAAAQMASTGSITVNAGATLHMQGGQQSVLPQSSMTGAGTVTWGLGYWEPSVDVVEGEYAVASTEVGLGAVQFDSSATTDKLRMIGGVLAGEGMFTVNDELTFAWGGTMSGPGITKANGPLRMESNGYLERVLEIDNFGWEPTGPAAGGTLTISPNSPGELRGIGTLDGSVNDFEGIAPGLPSIDQPIGSLSITGNFTQYSIPPGQLHIEISGAAHDLLDVGGTATLSGHLNVTGNPSGGASYTILTAQNVIGNFSQTNLPPGMTVSYTPTSVIVQAAPGAPCPADIAPLPDGNGVVDVDDLLVVINGWGACETGEECPSDIVPVSNGNGVVDVDDLLLVINAWGTCDS